MDANWLEKRRKGIGGSDVAAILGISPWKTAYSIYLDKRHESQDGDQPEDSPIMDWGKRMEPALRQWYSDQTQRVVRISPYIIFSKKYPFMLASLDGFTDDRRVVELKTARHSIGWGEPGTNKIPDIYACQVQHYMIVTGFDVSDVVVSIAGSPPELYVVEADKELQELLIDAESEFWDRVKQGNPPEPVSYADVVQRFSLNKVQGQVLAADITVTHVDELRKVKEARKELESQEDELTGKIILELGDKGDILVDSMGDVLATYKMAKGRDGFNINQLKKDDPELYGKYKIEGKPSRRFLLK